MIGVESVRALVFKGGGGVTVLSALPSSGTRWAWDMGHLSC